MTVSKGEWPSGVGPDQICAGSRENLISPDQLSGKILPQEYNYEMENAAAFLTKISFLHSYFVEKIHEEPQIINHNNFTHCFFILFSCGCHILIFIITCHDLLKFSPREITQTRLHSNWSISRMFTASMISIFLLCILIGSKYKW